MTLNNIDTVFQEQSIKILLYDKVSNGTFSISDCDDDRVNKRYSNVYENEEIINQFRNMQEFVVRKEVPILTKLLSETSFDDGYESLAEKYFTDLSEKYGIIADTVLSNIYLQNMYENNHLIKHLLFIVANLSKERRKNLEIVPIAGLSNPDIEIQDLSVRCFESWQDKRHIPSLETLKSKTIIAWFKNYIEAVIMELKEV